VSAFVAPPHSASPGLVAVLAPFLFARAAPRWALRALMLGADAPDEDVARLRDVLRRVPPRVLAARLREVQSRDVTRSFLRCRVPMLLLDGRDDRLLPARVARDLVALRPDVEHVRLDGPHLLMQQRVEATCGVLVPFLMRAAGGDRSA
jgi:pimeloyl-ACP methyl ester carboxylesterase